MPSTTTVIIGAGHCGLAMSGCLTARSIDHVILERAEVANSWRTQRWDSLRLLTPNWMTRDRPVSVPRRRPGRRYQRTASRGDARGLRPRIRAPVRTGTTVTSVRAAGGGFVVRTDEGVWHAPTVVLACGGTTLPTVPGLARLAPPGSTRSPGGLSQPRRAAPGRCPGGRRRGQRGSARRRTAPLRAPGHARHRRARPHAAYLPRPGHPVVAGRRRGAGPALRRG